jgi:hypothetical protein
MVDREAGVRQGSQPMILEQQSADRRDSSRFPITREISYRTLGKRGGFSGDGTTIIISSSGVLFVTNDPPRTGARLELSISWPVRLNERCALKLVVRGRVARSEPGYAAVEIQQHEFRTLAHP